MTHNASPGTLSPVKQALHEIRRLREQLSAERRARTEPVAVVGLGLRLPGDIATPEALWNCLLQGLDATGPVPSGRWDHDAFFRRERDVPGTYYAERGGFLSSVADFDPEFFGIAPLEATTMDPQQRMLLDTAWEALEHAGISPASLAETRTGVFVGIGNSDYGRLVLSEPDAIDAYATSGTSYGVASGRVAYFLGLRGPAVSIDTACSSSLVATHLACQSLRSRESDVVLAGGVNLILTPELTVDFCRAGMLSADGRCKTFDADADGYGRGEGCGVVVLKRLSDAQRDGDRILALIRGSAINQDGRSNGLTAPSGPAQEAVIRDALERAEVRSEDVGYVEAHGTGTSLGDPIEVQALGAVYGRDRPAERPLLIGSAKTNFGHLEAAAGMVGLIKTILALRAGEIPPSLHLRTPNPHIAWDQLPIRVATERTPFESFDGRRLAGVSSFGFSGTNAHVILEEAPERAPVSAQNGALQLLLLSAPSQEGLRALAARWSEHLLGTSDSFADVCHTAAVGRAHFSHRAALVAASAEQAASVLERWTTGEYAPELRMGETRAGESSSSAFLFGGDSPHTEALNRLANDFAVVREIRDAYQAVPALAAHLAIAALWKSAGVSASIVAGSGIGALAMGVLAGVFTREDALRIASAIADQDVTLEDTIRSALMPAQASVQILSGATGEPVHDLRDWLGVLTAPAAWDGAIEAVAAEGARRLIEIAPLARSNHARGVARVESPLASGDPRSNFLNGLAQLYAAGCDLEWQQLVPQAGRVSLPAYPFQRRRFWYDAGRRPRPVASRPAASHSGIRTATTDAAWRQSGLAPLEMNIGSYAEKWRVLDELAVVVIRNALVSLGAFRVPNETFDIEALLRTTGTQALYARIVERCLRALVERGEVERAGQAWRVARPIELLDASPLLAEVDRLLADDPPLLRYIRNAAGLVPDVLAGRTSALETLFPGGSFDLAAALYQDSTILRYVNGIAAAALERYVALLPSTDAIRVLEVGGGTGGTTASLLPVLPAGRTRYDFTDVSPIFFDYSLKKLAPYTFVSANVLDIEKDPVSQGFAAAGYDVVVASNAIHAVRQLQPSLTALRKLLRPGGLLLLVESTGHHGWHDITTGLIEGWQHYEDALRKETPLLDDRTWLDVLAGCGFELATVAPAIDSPAAILKQQVLLAFAPGERTSIDAPDASEALPGPAGTRTAEPDRNGRSQFVQELHAASPAEREDIVILAVRECVMHVLRSDPDRPPSRDARLMELGLDSLMAVRLRNVLEERLQLPFPLPATLVFDHPTVRHVARLVLDGLQSHSAQPEEAGPGNGRSHTDAAAVRLAEVTALDDGEVEALLLERLDDFRNEGPAR